MAGIRHWYLKKIWMHLFLVSIKRVKQQSGFFGMN